MSTFRHDYETFIIHNPIDDVGADKLRDAIGIYDFSTTIPE
jgi:hypothetical protein|uniref:Uncharacterized protein n=1 Tax=Candidatus Methanogaster sp. ANME-2c ERB4 TaxID=2759911 RepID=A0A7G9YPU5_9EURY|nr:hypothetical protein MMAJBCMK_00012 [Methanosarcinales archaeon ANME-2c ERB4]